MISGSGHALVALSCSSSGCGFGGMFELGVKMAEYFAKCEKSNLGNQNNVLFCLIDKIYGPNSGISPDCKPCICEVICSIEPSYCNICKCGQDIFIPAPKVVPCITTNITKDHDIVGGILCSLYNYKTQAKTVSLPASCKTDVFCSELSSQVPLSFKGATCSCVFDKLSTTILNGISENTLSKDAVSSNRNLIPLALEILANLPQNGCKSAICENMLGSMLGKKSKYSSSEQRRLAHLTDYCECGYSISPTLDYCPTKDPEISMENSLICASKNIPFNSCKSTVSNLLCSQFGETSVECDNSDCATKTLPILFNCMIESAGNVSLAINCTFEALKKENCDFQMCDVSCDIFKTTHTAMPPHLLPKVCLSSKICENILSSDYGYKFWENFHMPS